MAKTSIQSTSVATRDDEVHESLSELDVARHVKERIETVKRETGSDLTKMLPIYMMDSDEDLIRNFESIWK